MSLLEKEISELGQASGHEDDLKAWSAKFEGLRAKLARERKQAKEGGFAKRASKLEKSEVAGVPKDILAGYLEKLKRLESLGHSGQNTMITKAKAPGNPYSSSRQLAG